MKIKIYKVDNTISSMFHVKLHLLPGMEIFIYVQIFQNIKYYNTKIKNQRNLLVKSLHTHS